MEISGTFSHKSWSSSPHGVCLLEIFQLLLCSLHKAMYSLVKAMRCSGRSGKFPIDGLCVMISQRVVFVLQIKNLIATQTYVPTVLTIIKK